MHTPEATLIGTFEALSHPSRSHFVIPDLILLTSPTSRSGFGARRPGAAPSLSHQGPHVHVAQVPSMCLKARTHHRCALRTILTPPSTLHIT